MATKLKITLKDGSHSTVECFCKFNYEIDGKMFRFAVTQYDTYKAVTHIASGLKLCQVSVGATYLPAYAKLDTDQSRAEMSILQAIDNYGAVRVREKLEEAEKAVAPPAAKRRAPKQAVCPPVPVSTVPMFYVYGKVNKAQRQFRLMDINAGVQVQKMRATRLTREEADKFMANEAPRNPDWIFEIRPIEVKS